jgi:hypothetical protein
MSRSTHIRRSSSLCSILLAASTLVLTTRCTEEKESPEEARASAEQCLPYEEVKNRCNRALNDCLDSPIQSIGSWTSGHSLCLICKDVCMQKNGVWPDKLWDGRPCRW